jgi:VIT1/CCC1 family predicted Fe2+/Mn2+ transporter
MSTSKRLLDPIDRTSEVLFGLIMALSFTCSISAVQAGPEDVRTMLLGALGCNVAWGIIDAAIFLMISLTERARAIATLRSLRSATSARQAQDIIAGALPPLLANTLSGDDYARIHRKLGEIAEPPSRPRLGKSEYLAALGVFLLVFLATFPVAVPFMLTQDAMLALRISNGVAIVMLFFCGYSLGRYAQHRPVGMGILMMVVGVLLVAVTIALGG